VSEPGLSLLSTGELLSGLVDEVAEIRAREHAVMRKIAELDRRSGWTRIARRDMTSSTLSRDRPAFGRGEARP
jgi:hypothetical protein